MLLYIFGCLSKINPLRISKEGRLNRNYRRNAIIDQPFCLHELCEFSFINHIVIQKTAITS